MYQQFTVMDNGEAYGELWGFGLGQYNYTNGSQYYESLLNDNYTQFGDYANLAQLTLDFSGLGLPSTIFWKFSNMLSYITNGASSCATFVGGYCVLPKNCSSYTTLWDYSFQVGFNGGYYYEPQFVVPLATFAYTDAANQCIINV